MNRIILPNAVCCSINVLFLEIQQYVNKCNKLTIIQVKFWNTGNGIFIFAKIRYWTIQILTIWWIFANMQVIFILYNSERINDGRKYIVWIHNKSVAKSPKKLAIPFYISSFQYGCHFVNWSSTAALFAAMYFFWSALWKLTSFGNQHVVNCYKNFQCKYCNFIIHGDCLLNICYMEMKCNVNELFNSCHEFYDCLLFSLH